MFVVYAAILLILVILFLAYPVWFKNQTAFITGKDAAVDEDRANLEIEKQSLLAILAELDFDHAQGKSSNPDYRRLKDNTEQHLVKVLHQMESLPAPGNPLRREASGSLSRFSGRSWTYTLAIGLFVLLGTAGIYNLIYGKIEREQRSTREEGGQPGQPPANPLEMVAKLEKRLKENPNDLQGQMMAGRSYMTLQRWEAAEKAWRKAVELDERNEVAQYNLADVLIRTAPPGNKGIYEEALDHLEKALINVPREPVVLWAKGVALVHLGRVQEADLAWTAAYQNLQPGSKDAEYVKEALENLRAGKLVSY